MTSADIGASNARDRDPDAEEPAATNRGPIQRLPKGGAPAPVQPKVVSKPNYVGTAKYSVWTFLPRGIFEQFRRVANIFFLWISIMMIIGTYGFFGYDFFYSPITPWTTVGPLAVIVGMVLVKEGFEDSKRHKADHEVRERVGGGRRGAGGAQTAVVACKYGRMRTCGAGAWLGSVVGQDRAGAWALCACVGACVRACPPARLNQPSASRTRPTVECGSRSGMAVGWSGT